MFSSIDWSNLIIGGVVVGLLVNFSSSYLYPKLESFVSNFSKSRRAKKEMLEEKIKNEVLRLANNPHEELVFRHYYYNLIRYKRFQSIMNQILYMTGLVVLFIDEKNFIISMLMVIAALIFTAFDGVKAKEISALQNIKKQLDTQNERPSYENW